MGDAQHLCYPHSVHSSQGERRENEEWEREKKGHGREGEREREREREEVVGGRRSRMERTEKRRGAKGVIERKG